ncbi:MAGE-domain-containing protein [Leucogyrophana mollusca]|uniref:MAGE-domain-containing protein n=1 Tax=Leucogyrophana mollusca TaxID=85980 RepID=A0ACB8BLL2_9AGAM|nr:MAGE-domain-containing protein [Leucogyrophana mollusca]
MPRAAPSRSQRTQNAPQASQSQRPTRGGRNRAPVEEEEDDDEQGEDEDEMDTGGSQARRVDGEAELDRKAGDLVRLALFMEHKRTALRREDITKKVLGSSSRSFGAVFEKAQKVLSKTFGMELVELQSRNYREQDNTAGDDLQEARNATGVKKKAAAAGSKTYILRSVLDPVIIEHAALSDERLLEEQMADDPEGDDDDIPRNYGSIISWSSTDQLGALGVLHVILALILVNGRTITDLDLRANLKRLGLPGSGSVTMTSHSTHKSLPIDTYLGQLIRQGYIDRQQLGGNKAAGGKRGRAPAATQANADDNQAWEWRWGNRAYSEIGEKAVGQFVAEFMVERTRDNDGDDDDDENAAPARARGRVKNRSEVVEKKLATILKGIERAAGGTLTDVR